MTYALLGGGDLLGLVLVFVGHCCDIWFSRLLSGRMTRLVACESSCYATRHGEAGLVCLLAKAQGWGRIRDKHLALSQLS